MTARAHIPLKAKLQAMCLIYRCPVCGEHLGPLEMLDWDHKQALALGGTNDPENLQPLHKACHKIKTNGTKATSYGSDKFEIAKTKRLAAGGEKRKTGRKIQSAGFQNAKQKMQSRGFEKRRME